MIMAKIWDWAYAAEALPLLAEASLITVKATLMGFVVALSLGLLFAIGRMAGPLWSRMAVGGLVEFIRSGRDKHPAHDQKIQLPSSLLPGSPHAVQ